MTCEELQELRGKGSENATTAEIASVLAHIRDCPACKEDGLKRYERAKRMNPEGVAERRAKLVDRITETIADPECREVLERGKEQGT